MSTKKRTLNFGWKKSESSSPALATEATASSPTEEGTVLQQPLTSGSPTQSPDLSANVETSSVHASEPTEQRSLGKSESTKAHKHHKKSHVDIQRTKEYMSSAEEDMAEIQQLLDDIEHSKAKRTNQVARMIFRSVGSTANVLEAVAQLHPVSQNVYVIFKSLYDLEKKRHEHDDDVADTFYALTRSMWCLGQLVSSKMDPKIEAKFQEISRNIETALNDFQTYLTNFYSQKIAIRTLTMRKAASQLEDFRKRFSSLGEDLNQFILISFTVNTREALSTSNDRLNQIFHQTEKAEERSEALQVEVRKGQNQIRQLQASISNSYNNVVQAMKNHHLDTRKMILQRLDEGPHSLISDPSMRKVWKDMRWRNSVECRYFLDAVQESFFTQFATEEKNSDRKHPDFWTLEVLSKSIFYPPIGDAIDSDSSSFVSVTELNLFLKQRPQHWNIAEWLTFWAIGWAQCTTSYRRKIHIKWKEIVAAVKEKASEPVTPSSSDNPIGRFIEETEEWIKNVIGVPDEDFEEDIVGPDVNTQLGRLNTMWTVLQEDKIAKGLEPNAIESQEDVEKITSLDRIEVSLMPLTYVWLSYFLVRYSQTKDEDITDLVTEFAHARTVFNGMLSRRLGELLQIWSQQKQDLKSQLNGFCSGILKSYHKNVFVKEREQKTMKQLEAYHDDDVV